MKANILKEEETTEEREDNGAEMSDEREMNDQMKKEYETGKDDGESRVEERERLNKQERDRTNGSLKNKTQV